MAPHKLTRLANDVLAGLTEFCDSVAAGTVDRDFAVRTFTTGPVMSGNVTLDDLVATTKLADDIRRKYEHLPVAVRASEEAIVKIRTALSDGQVEADRVLLGFGPGMFSGIPIYLDPRLKPGEWRWVWSWENSFPEKDASRRGSP